MITAVLTGMSGSERREVAVDLSRFAVSQGYAVTFIDLWEEMQATDPTVSEATILNVADAHRAQIVREAFHKIEVQLERLRQEQPGEKTAAIVGTHATFFWNSSYLEGFPETLLTQLQPEVLFTVEHNAVDLFYNLREDANHRFDQITQSDVLYWRDRETEDTARWARGLRAPHFLISRSEPVEILFRLLFQRRRKRVYVSYPMSHVTEQQREAAQDLIGELRRKGYVVFDPGALEDLEQVGRLLAQPPSERGSLAGLSDAELSNILRTVGNQTVKRDYRLIDQSDLLVVYYPSLPSHAPDSSSAQASAGVYIPLSAGVICEMVHGHSSGKKVYAAWLPPAEPSPFFTYHTHRVTRSAPELLELMLQLDPP